MNASEQYNRAQREYREAHQKGSEKDREKAGRKLKDAALERAERREWAHKRRGSEKFWSE